MEATSKLLLLPDYDSYRLQRCIQQENMNRDDSVSVLADWTGQERLEEGWRAGGLKGWPSHLPFTILMAGNKSEGSLSLFLHILGVLLTTFRNGIRG